jgi:LAO/AO transport system kinase
VLLVSARDGTGVAELVEAVDAHHEQQRASGELLARRRRSRAAYVIEALERRYGSFGVEALGGRAALRARIADEPSLSSFALAAALGREIEEALHKSV